MKIGLLFPGQGAQVLGMGKDVYDVSEEYRDLYKKVKEISGIDVDKITFENEELLNQTKYTQLAILTMSLALLNEIEKEVKIDEEYLAGLSLGEYSALIRSKALSFEDGIKIVKERGFLMQEMCPKGNWAMAAIMGLDENKVNEVCEEINGFVKPANFNTVGQIVVSGEKSAIDEIMVLAKEKGAKRVLELNTSGPFHTEKLLDAATELRKKLDDVKFNNMDKKVVKNLDGKIYDETSDIKEILEKHIISSVRFEDSINTMISNGVDTFIEIGPGKTLSGFVKRISKDVKVLNVCDKASLENVITFIKNGGEING